MAYRNRLGMIDEDDELERRRRADEVASFGMGSPDAWLEQQANRNPAWMRRQPDMSIGTFEAEQAPDMEIGLDEAEARPDMSFSEQETATAPDPLFRPDMTISLEEAEANRPQLRSQPMAAGYESEMQPRMSALMPRDGGIEGRWAEAENRALDRSGYGAEEEYGLGEGIRDFAPMAIGGTLDILLNKGRGLGELAAGGMQALSMENTRRDRAKQAAANDALAMRRQRQYDDQAGLRSGDQALGWANYAERVKTGQRLGERQDFDINPENPQAQAMSQHVEGLTGVDQSGLSVRQQGQAMPLARGVQELEIAPQKAAAVTRAELDTEHELAPRTAADAGMRGAAVEAITRPEKMITAAEERDIKNPALDSGGAPMLPQGIRDTTGKFAQLAQRNPDEALRTTNTVQDMTKLERLTGEMIKVRQAIDKIPLQGRTRNNPEFAALLGQWEENEGAYQAEYFRAQDRGAPQVYEDRRFQGQIGQPMTWEDGAGQPIAAFRSALTDQENLLKGRMAALQQRRAAFIEAKFGPQGDAAPSGGAQQRPDRLPVTGQKRADVPRVDDVISGGGKPRATRQPNGAWLIDGGDETYTEEEIQRLMRKGAIQ